MPSLAAVHSFKIGLDLVSLLKIINKDYSNLTGSGKQPLLDPKQDNERADTAAKVVHASSIL